MTREEFYRGKDTEGHSEGAVIIKGETRRVRGGEIEQDFDNCKDVATTESRTALIDVNNKFERSLTQLDITSERVCKRGAKRSERRVKKQKGYTRGGEKTEY